MILIVTTTAVISTVQIQIIARYVVQVVFGGRYCATRVWVGRDGDIPAAANEGLGMCMIPQNPLSTGIRSKISRPTCPCTHR